MKLDIDQGPFFNGAEDKQRAHVSVIGSEAKTKLFSGGWAVGEEDIRLNGETFTIVGVLVHPRSRSRRTTSTASSTSPSTP